MSLTAASLRSAIKAHKNSEGNIQKEDRREGDEEEKKPSDLAAPMASFMC